MWKACMKRRGVCVKARQRLRDITAALAKEPHPLPPPLLPRADLYMSHIPQGLLTKNDRQSTFNLCGSDLLPLGQTLICQRLGFQPVTLLR